MADLSMMMLWMVSQLQAPPSLVCHQFEVLLLVSMMVLTQLFFAH